MSDNYDDQMAARERFDAAYTQNAYMLFSMLRPSVAKDGDQWCVLYGDDLQIGIAGFGNTPHQAVIAWNAEWHKTSASAAAPQPEEGAGVMKKTLHLMTQDGQPYGSKRKCCEICGTMLRNRPDSFWIDCAWTDERSEYENCAVEHPEYISCSDKKKEPRHD